VKSAEGGEGRWHYSSQMVGTLAIKENELHLGLIKEGLDRKEKESV